MKTKKMILMAAVLLSFSIAGAMKASAKSYVKYLTKNDVVGVIAPSEAFAAKDALLGELLNAGYTVVDVGLREAAIKEIAHSQTGLTSNQIQVGGFYAATKLVTLAKDGDKVTIKILDVATGSLVGKWTENDENASLDKFFDSIDVASAVGAKSENVVVYKDGTVLVAGFSYKFQCTYNYSDDSCISTNNGRFQLVYRSSYSSQITLLSKDDRAGTISKAPTAYLDGGLSLMQSVTRLAGLASNEIDFRILFKTDGTFCYGLKGAVMQCYKK